MQSITSFKSEQFTINYIIRNRALKPSELKMKAILDFARFLSSGCFIWDLGFIPCGFAVVVCVRGVLLGGFVRVAGFVESCFVRGVLWGGGGGLSRGVLFRVVLSKGGFVQWGFCPRGVLSSGFCPRI